MEIEENKSFAFQPLNKKVQKSIEIIRDTEKQCGKDNIAVAWTGGKDSTTVLHLVKSAYEGVVPFKVINIDTSVKFREIYDFRDRIAKEWNLDLKILKHPDAKRIISEAKDAGECCFLLKTNVLEEGIKAYGVKALITGIRWDEHTARSEEKYYSERKGHVRVNPILHFLEKDIWQYIRTNQIPYCSLYDQGYRSLGCAPCTAVGSESGPERDGRKLDKEEIMQNLRELGYF